MRTSRGSKLAYEGHVPSIGDRQSSTAKSNNGRTYRSAAQVHHQPWVFILASLLLASGCLISVPRWSPNQALGLRCAPCGRRNGSQGTHSATSGTLLAMSDSSVCLCILICINLNVPVGLTLFSAFFGDCQALLGFFSSASIAAIAPRV